MIEDNGKHPTAEAAVDHDVPFGYGGDVYHTAEFLTYLPRGKISDGINRFP